MSPEPGSRQDEKAQRRWPERVQDIISAATEIEGFVAGHTFDSFRADAKTIKAVLADIAIIGEAVVHIPERARSLVDGVPWRQIRDMRNIIAHVYFGVDIGKVWDTATRHLPLLIPKMRELLEKAPPP